MTAAPSTPAAATPAQVARAFGVVFAGPVALLGGVAAAAAAAGRAMRRRDAPPVWACLTLTAAAVHVAVVRPWMGGWGATAAERQAPLPGDRIVPAAASQTTRAVTVQAPAAAVWPWLAQIGQDRGGFYSYERLENLAGCRMRNADRIHPEWQRREVGEAMMLHPANGLPVTLFEPGRAIGIEGWGVFVVEPVDARTSRVYARQRLPRGPTRWAYALLLEIPHFIMERAMLLGLKRRAEETAGRG